MDWLVGGLVGDYLLQNDWLAKGKKRSHWICALHALIYTLCVCLFTGWWDWTLFGAIWLPHFLIDRGRFIAWYMDMMGQKDFRTGALSPWSQIAVDNVFHLVHLWLIATYWPGLS